MLDSIHFLIPGGAGGGWDGTARGTGEALTNAGPRRHRHLREHVGRRRRRGHRHLIENAQSSDGTLMVNSTPIVIRALTGEIAQSFRDLTLVAGTVGDYAALVVTADSPIQTMEDALAMYREAPARFRHRRRFGSRRHGPPRRGHRDAGRGRRPDGLQLHRL